MGLESKYEEPDLDIEFVDIDQDLQRTTEKRRDRLQVGANAGRDEKSYLRRDEEIAQKEKEKTIAQKEKALSDEDAFIVPTLEIRKGDEAPTEVSMEKFKRASSPKTKSDHSESNLIIFLGFGAIIFFGLILFAVIKLI